MALDAAGAALDSSSARSMRERNAASAMIG
jgi:hypothetical protein